MLATLEKYFLITKKQIKLTLFIHLLFAFFMIVLFSTLFGIKNLDATASSFLLERFIALIGIILITPIFWAEQNPIIAEITESKTTSPNVIYLIRLFLANLTLFALICSLVATMLVMSCKLTPWENILGTYASAFFLGSIGFLAYSVFNHIIFAYMLPLLYYFLHLFLPPREFENFYLFSMSYGSGSFQEKYWLMGGGVFLIAAGLLVRVVIRRIR